MNKGNINNRALYYKIMNFLIVFTISYSLFYLTLKLELTGVNLYFVGLAIIFITILLSYFVLNANYSEAVSLEGGDKKNDETDQLISAFVSMADKLESRDEDEIVSRNSLIQDNKEKAEFFATITHELRTPMHAILSTAEMGKSQAASAPREKMEKFFERIEISGDRLLKLINEVLDLSKLESREIGFNIRHDFLNSCIEDVVKELESYAEKKQIKINVKYSDGCERAFFDNDRIKQVLVNLLSNAIKFTPEGKEISINTVKNTYLDQNGSTSMGVQVSIEDGGEGFPEGEAGEIFRKFAQGSHNSNYGGGTGLGLSICEQIINQHNGKIWAENSLEGGGAVFTFIIPVENKN